MVEKRMRGWTREREGEERRREGVSEYLLATGKERGTGDSEGATESNKET